MDINITKEEKIASARIALQQVEMEYCRQIISLGEDPEIFDVEKLLDSDNLQEKSAYDNLKFLQQRILKIRNIIATA